MVVALDLTGKQYGRLTAVRRVNLKHGTGWECVCSCGNIKQVYTQNLRNGKTKSCGCYQSDHQSQVITERNTVHGHNVVGNSTPTYRSWIAMRQRCNDQNSDNYPNYGGRGITICERWDNFLLFLEDMGERPPDTSIDRIDVNGNYEKDNCRWATRSQQQKNKRCHVKCN